MEPQGLVARIVALHLSLSKANIAHAFGGALALAFCTEEPRATQDIDVNIFLGTNEVDGLVAGLPEGMTPDERNRRELERDGQSRLWWGRTPVDIFLANHRFHDHAEANRRHVPFAGVERLPVLACADLAVFKTFFARPKDGVDLATMAAAGAIDLDALEASVRGLLGSDDRADFLSRVRSDLERIRTRPP